MSKFFIPGLIIALLVPALALAHGPSRVRIDQTIEINAPAEKVWSIISDFCSIKDWNPAVTGCKSDNGTQPDSNRVITLENGQQMKEKLVKHDPTAHRYQYMLVEPNVDAFPINTHGATITVTEDGGKTIVEWKGAFYRAFPGPNPPPELSDEAASKALTDFYLAGLETIKKLAEQ